jgi:hypothetical protein
MEEILLDILILLHPYLTLSQKYPMTCQTITLFMILYVSVQVMYTIISAIQLYKVLTENQIVKTVLLMIANKMII